MGEYISKKEVMRLLQIVFLGLDNKHYLKAVEVFNNAHNVTTQDILAEAMTAVKKVSEIEQIINIPNTTIQEDVFRYKAICMTIGKGCEK